MTMIDYDKLISNVKYLEVKSQIFPPQLLCKSIANTSYRVYVQNGSSFEGSL